MSSAIPPNPIEVPAAPFGQSAEVPPPVETVEEPEKKAKISDADLLHVLKGYYEEGRSSREGGPNARDETWRLNLEAYWNRYETVDKAEWQAKQTMPEVSSFTERHVSVIAEALTSGGDWFNVVDVLDKQGLTPPMVKTVIELMRKLTRTLWYVARGARFNPEQLFNLKAVENS